MTFLLDSLLLDDSDAQLDRQGTLNFAGVDNSLGLDAGTLLLNKGGVIHGVTIQSHGGTLITSGGTKPRTIRKRPIIRRRRR